MNVTQNFDKEVLRTQLKARNVMKREMLIFYALIAIGTLLCLLFGFRSYYGFIVFLLYLLIVRTVAVWYQWNFLVRFNLKCPHCGQPLAGRLNLLKNPGEKCPHCGQLAMIPIKQLEAFEKSEANQ